MTELEEYSNLDLEELIFELDFLASKTSGREKWEILREIIEVWFELYKRGAEIGRDTLEIISANLPQTNPLKNEPGEGR